MPYVLLCISLTLGVGKNLLSAVGKEKFQGLKNLLFLNVVTALAGFIVFSISGIRFSLMQGWQFFTLSALYALFTVLSQTFFVMAVKSGETSVCSMIYSSGFLIPTLFSIFYFHENASVWKIVGIILLFISVFVISVPLGKKSGEKKRKYLPLAFAAMLCSGGVGVLQKLFADVCNVKAQNEFLLFAFFLILIFSLASRLMLQKRTATAPVSANSQDAATPEKKYIFWLLATAFALCIALTNKFNLYLGGAIDGVIFFPVYNGGCIVFTGIFSALLLKEKPTKQKWLGILGGLLAIVFISL